MGRVHNIRNNGKRQNQRRCGLAHPPGTNKRMERYCLRESCVRTQETHSAPSPTVWPALRTFIRMHIMEKVGCQDSMLSGAPVPKLHPVQQKSLQICEYEDKTHTVHVPPAPKQRYPHTAHVQPEPKQRYRIGSSGDDSLAATMGALLQT